MDPIIQKLYSGDSAKLIHELITTYQDQGHAVVNFLYFANAMQYRLFEANASLPGAAYKQALLGADFLLPDGIALQLWSKRTEKKSVHNLNGTDFTPLFLEYLNTHYPKGSVSLSIYSLYDPKIDKGKERLDKAVANLHDHYPHIHIPFSYQSLYSNRGEDFPREALKARASSDASEIKVFLHCTGTPFQELWVEEYKDFFEKYGFLVMNVGGFIDFVAGFEHRAPRWVVKARVLETFWRVCTNPRKNLKKFLAMFGIFRILSRRLRLKKKSD